MLNRVILATRNKNKIEEMRAILAPLGIELVSALDIPDLVDVVEDQDTLEGNALKKARYVNKVTGIPALSDDTGLEVEALDGAPGVYSARYAGEDATYNDNVMKLLGALSDEKNRSAQFRTVIALVDDDKEYTFDGICEGDITLDKRGENGFGYDPVFQPTGYEKTFAELDAAIKNNISHRGRAVQAFIEFLKDAELD
ncbi:RdgB/HAM1 family non-canonical purine NTP pyrophosphatase [Balneola vulgaris]|uniref:RdgB/HAM1 family non-canonical purine NTP pyrophosphatase n=1 Tax=Balneola vulgaris TaxID=287535 RepID=UPI00037E78F4|nr:RdgB/HAM1 family non-canonical purine NTP pyrophosphatase [Balneola vulgaris]